jgi:Phosphodiester glycosidase
MSRRPSGYPAGFGSITRRRAVLLVVLALLAVPAVSFAQAMFYPGNAPASVRAVEWVRDHGGGGIVDAIENWRYSRNVPPVNGPPQDRIPAGTANGGGSPSRPAHTAGLTLPVVPLLSAGRSSVKPISGEGVWTGTHSTGGAPALYTTWFRPDPKHTPIVVAAALIPQRLDALHLVAGTREPVPGLSWPEHDKVPAAARRHLVAVFNAGFKTADSHGGWYGDGRTAVKLRSGKASLVITTDGRAKIGIWNQDVRMGPDVVAVRQNLDPVIENGHPVAGLSHNAAGNWGSARSQFQYTARSGLGTDRNGDLIYVAGQGLNLTGLAQAMVKAGIQTGMELDIHPSMITFNSFTGSGSGLTGHRLLASMKRPSKRYLTADQRDFFYVTSR